MGAGRWQCMRVRCQKPCHCTARLSKEHWVCNDRLPSLCCWMTMGHFEPKQACSCFRKPSDSFACELHGEGIHATEAFLSVEALYRVCRG